MHYNYINKHGKLLDRKILGEDVEEEIKRVEHELYIREKPLIYGGEKGVLLKTEKDFESNCATLQNKGIYRPKQLTVSEFYSNIKILEKQSTNNGKRKGNTKRT